MGLRGEPGCYDIVERKTWVMARVEHDIGYGIGFGDDLSLKQLVFYFCEECMQTISESSVK